MCSQGQIFNYGKTSTQRLNSACLELQFLAKKALSLSIIDITIIEGVRGSERQFEMFSSGKSRLEYPNSPHNACPSDALDMVPYINNRPSWSKLHCCVLAGIMLTLAKQFDIPLRWGGNWDMDYEPITDQEFQDLAHYEIVRRPV